MYFFLKDGITTVTWGWTRLLEAVFGTGCGDVFCVAGPGSGFVPGLVHRRMKAVCVDSLQG